MVHGLPKFKFFFMVTLQFVFFQFKLKFLDFFNPENLQFDTKFLENKMKKCI
jgi:hypothetical protein